MKSVFFSFVLLGLSSGLLAQTPVPVPEALDYIRYLDETAASDRLQTAVVRFEKAGTIVDLVAVIHLGDAAYFQNLNTFLKSYDWVLYEMVGGEYQAGTDAAESPAVAEEMAGVRHLQQLAKSFLGLEFQLDGIDYTAPNFIHADVEWDEFNELMTVRNQSFATLFTRAMSLAEEGGISGVPNDEAVVAAMMKRLFSALMTGNSDEIKRTVAPLVSEAEGFITQLEGEDGTVLVTERNRVVMEKLGSARKEKGAGHYAIFYGAGHMPDLERRLIADGFRKRTTTWADAWTIPDAAIAAADGSGSLVVSPADLLIKLMDGNPEIMNSIQQLGTLLESLNKAVE